MGKIDYRFTLTQNRLGKGKGRWEMGNGKWETQCSVGSLSHLVYICLGVR